MQPMPKINKHSPAFTLVELLVAVPMIVVVIGIITGLMLVLVGNVIASNAKNQMIYDSQSALNQIEQDAFLSTSYVDTYTAPAPQMKNDTSGAYDATPSSGTPDIIFNQLGTTKNPLDPSRNITYYARPNPCSGEQAANDMFFLKVVYFVKSGALYRRSIVPLNNTNSTPDGDTVCATPWQRGSCTEGYAANARCQVKDTKLVDNVASMAVTYYNKATPGTAITNASLADSLRVTMNLTRKAAGDNYSHSITLSATRTNSLPTATAVPTAPTISISGDYPAGGAIFTWNPVANASSYDVRYSNNNGSSWSAIKNIPANQTELNYNTVEATGTQNIFGGETVQVQVTAKNEIGSSQATQSFVIPVWKPCPLSGSVTNYGGNYSTAAYTYTSAGVVLIQGFIANASGTNTGICTVPLDYAPSDHYYFASRTSTGPSYTEIYPTGEVKATFSTNSYHTLDSIAYIPKQTSYSWTNFSLLNNWWEFDGYAYPRYTVDSLGRIHIDFMPDGSSGTKTDNINIATASFGSLNVPYRLMTAASPGTASGTGTINNVRLGSNGTTLEIKARGNNVSWLSLHAMVHQANSGWTNLTYSSGFSTRSGYGGAAYKMDSDGIVMLRGLINLDASATAGKTITTLPNSICPSKQLTIPVSSNNSTGTLTVTAAAGSGCSVQVHVLASSSSGGYFGLDGMLWRIGT